MPAQDTHKPDDEPVAVAAPAGKDGKDKEQEKKKVEELSEEDLALKEGLELAVVRLQDEDDSLHKPALEHLVNEIRSATSSMTSVPKPLKFLRPHYDAMKAIYEAWPTNHAMKRMMADVLSVLAMTMAPAGSRECLKFKLVGTLVNVSSWGHEYVRSLSGEIAEEFNQRVLDAEGMDTEADDLMTLVDDILPFQMKHNAEAEAVDLLMEVGKLEKLVKTPVVDDRNYERVCLYLIRSASYVVDPDDLEVLYDTTFQIYRAQGKLTDALRVAMRMGRDEYVLQLFAEDAATPATKKQMALILAAGRSQLTVGDDALDELISNAKLSEQFLSVVKDMDLAAPKHPDDIYKTQLADARIRSALNNGAAGLDSARANLASSFVNGFVNAGYCADKLVLVEESNWVTGKNKAQGMLAAAASTGLLMLWNVEEGLNQLDKYFHSADDNIKAGACLGVGVCCTGVRNEADPALALLVDHIEDPKSSSAVRTASVSGLGIAYAGAKREEVQALLEVIMGNSDSSIVEASMAALSLGMVFIGTGNDEIGGVILQRLMETSDTDLSNSMTRFMCLALGLLFLGLGERVEAILEASRTIEHRIGKYAEVVLETCAYAGSGNVLKVQQMLRLCADHLTENAEFQSAAVVGIALVAMGEEVGTEMTLRTLEHLLQYGELPVRRAVPLALALLFTSNPEYSIIDLMSRLTHDADAELATAAILGLGIMSAGTNNSRVGNLLRQLADFYAKEANHLFMVRIAQGLNGMAKGLMTLSPLHSDRVLLNGPGLGGLLVVLHACLDAKNTLLDKQPGLLYFLACAMRPRYMRTVDENLAPVKATVRVGMAVETVGQAGRPKTITGFQTHTSPVLLGHKDRAELAGRDYTPLTSVMEGLVIVQPVPEEPLHPAITMILA